MLMVIISISPITTDIRIRLAGKPDMVTQQTGSIPGAMLLLTVAAPNPVIPRLKISITRVAEVFGRVLYPVLFGKRVRALNTGKSNFLDFYFCNTLKKHFIKTFHLNILLNS